MSDKITPEQIFNAAVEIESRRERTAYLNQACRDDAALRAEVEDLLRHDSDAGSFLEKPPEELDATIGGDSGIDYGAAWRALLGPSQTPGCIGTLGPYEVVELIGRGGMGVVLRARDPKLNRAVAVKLLAPEWATNPMAVRRFLREAQAAAAVSHDHVVTIHAIDEEAQPPLIVMEYVDGQSLQQKIDEDGALDLRSILRVGMQTAGGLAAAHRQGLVHRDVKPSNILLENGIERVKLTDFGLARAVDDIGVTRTGQITGTPQYMSPEQALGRRVDHRTDLFSLGCVIYAMCTGRAAFRADSAVAVMHRVVHDAPRPIQDLNEDIPDWLCEIVEKLLAKDAVDRFESAIEVEELLSRHLAHLQQPDNAPQPERVSAVNKTSQAISTKSERETASAPGIPILVWFGAVILLIVAVTAIVEVTRRMKVATPGAGGRLEDSTAEAAAREAGADDPPPFARLSTTWGDPNANRQVICLDASRNGKWLAAGHQYSNEEHVGEAVIWPIDRDGAESTALQIPGGARLLDIAISPDSTRWAWVQDDGYLTVLPIDGKALTNAYRHGPSDGALFSLAWSPDGSRIITGGDGKIVVWDRASSHEKFQPVETMHVPNRHFSKHSQALDLAVSPTGDKLAVGCSHGGVYLFDLTQPKLRLIDSLHDKSDGYDDNGAVLSIAWTQDGKSIEYGCQNGSIQRRSIDGKGAGYHGVSGSAAEPERRHQPVAMSPDGTVIATAEGDGFDRKGKPFTWRLNLRRFGSGYERVRGESHKGEITSLVFTHDGRHIVSGSRDGLIKWWRFEEPLAREPAMTRPAQTALGEIDRWQGSWTPIAVKSPATEIFTEQELSDFELKIDGIEATWTDGNTQRRGWITCDASSRPHKFEVVLDDNAGHIHGVCELYDDWLMIAFRLSDEGERPLSFKPEQHVRIVKYRRQRQSEAPRRQNAEVSRFWRSVVQTGALMPKVRRANRHANAHLNWVSGSGVFKGNSLIETDNKWIESFRFRGTSDQLQSLFAHFRAELRVIANGTDARLRDHHWSNSENAFDLLWVSPLTLGTMHVELRNVERGDPDGVLRGDLEFQLGESGWSGFARPDDLPPSVDPAPGVLSWREERERRQADFPPQRLSARANDSGNWLDLLADVDPLLDARGQWWSRDEKGGFFLTTTGGSFGFEGFIDPRVRLDDPSGYELEVTLTPSGQGASVPVITFPVGGAWCSFSGNSNLSPSVGLERFDGKLITQNGNTTVVRGYPLKDGVRQMVKISVAVVRDEGEIKVFLDGKQLLHWRDDIRRLTVWSEREPPWPGGFGIGARVFGGGSMTYHSARLRLK